MNILGFLSAAILLTLMPGPDHAKYYPGKESGNYFCLRVVYGVNRSHGGCEFGTFFDFI